MDSPLFREEVRFIYRSLWLYRFPSHYLPATLYVLNPLPGISIPLFGILLGRLVVFSCRSANDSGCYDARGCVSSVLRNGLFMSVAV